EAYSRTPEGALYTYEWQNLREVLKMEDTMPCPIHEDPLHLVPPERRAAVLSVINNKRDRQEAVSIRGDVCPACRYVFRELMRHYRGDWELMVKNHILVKRMVLSERDRIGIGTF